MELPNIEAERARRGVKKSDFAKMLGVSQKTVQNWQNGKTEMPSSKIVFLSILWCCSTDYLLGLQPNDTTRPLATQPTTATP